MGRGNGNAPMVDASALVEQLLGGGQQMSAEQRKAQARASFEAIVEQSVNGCPGAKDDEDHRLRDEALVTLIQKQMDWSLLPEAVAQGVQRYLALHVTHGPGRFGEVLDGEGHTVTNAMLVAGVVLKVLEQASTQGVEVRTGNYL